MPVYRYKGVAQVPRDKDDRDVGYDLLDLHDTLWARRHEVGNDKTFGAKEVFPNGEYGASLNGDNYGHDGADAPWFWGFDQEAGLVRGVWFFNPAHAMRKHFPRSKERFSTEYLLHPYLASGVRP